MEKISFKSSSIYLTLQTFHHKLNRKIYKNANTYHSGQSWFGQYDMCVLFLQSKSKTALWLTDWWNKGLTLRTSFNFHKKCTHTTTYKSQACLYDWYS